MVETLLRALTNDHEKKAVIVCGHYRNRVRIQQLIREKGPSQQLVDRIRYCAYFWDDEYIQTTAGTHCIEVYDNLPMSILVNKYKFEKERNDELERRAIEFNRQAVDARELEKDARRRLKQLHKMMKRIKNHRSGWRTYYSRKRRT